MKKRNREKREKEKLVLEYASSLCTVNTKDALCVHFCFTPHFKSVGSIPALVNK